MVSRAKDLYTLGDNPAVLVTIFFNDYHEIQKSKVESLVCAIVELVRRNIPEQGGQYEEQYGWSNRAYFPREIHILRVRRIPQVTKTFFSAPGATWVSTLSMADIHRVIAAKEAKCSKYLMQCDEAWLLINTDLSAMSSWFDFEEEPINHLFTTNFHRVFLMRHFAGQLYELKLQSPHQI